VRFQLRVGDATFAHDVSDLTDALGDLVRATVQIVCGGEAAECLFELEPGELTLHLERGHGGPKLADALRVTITESGGGRISAEVFSSDCRPDNFGQAVCILADSLFERGTDAFHERWQMPFPARARAALREALATPGA